MPAFFSNNHKTLLKCAKRFPFISIFSFWKKRNLAGPKSSIRWLRHDYGFGFGQKPDVWAGKLSLCKIQFCGFLTNYFSQSEQNFKVVFLIGRTTFCREFMMHQAIRIEENSEQNFYIWPNLTAFYLSWLFWTLPLECLGFGFNVILIQP